MADEKGIGVGGMWGFIEKINLEYYLFSFIVTFEG